MDMERTSLPKVYDPKTVEDRIYALWLKGNYFHAIVDRDKKPYTIVIPPPNITGQLHMGHALDNTLQDILIRVKRMQGYSALWLPGTDHASIATEARIVDTMKKEGLTKEGIGREKFLERAWDWKRVYGGRIIEQLKKLGSSCDWERERFTLDEGCSRAVNEVFVRLYDKGLIYRGERIINWCPECLTSISDAEVEFEEHAGHFWHIKYPLTDGSGFLTLATTRPETMLGDTAVAVNPTDERYKALIGKTVTLPLVGREIPVIADDYVEKDFGTGVVKITPAHDPNDFEVGRRHNLPIINVMTDNAYINENGGRYAGQSRYEARKQIVSALEEQGLLLKVEDITHNVGTCYRCSTVVEPRVSLQWFVKMEPLAKPAIEAVKKGETKFVPERFDKIYFNWMENIRDWCISRQLWWGHRIPAYYCSCGHTSVSASPISACEKCGGAVCQDEDTLDTWFSSALWPFSTLGWPDKTEELDFFYPTNTLVTGYDIIFFWVARMIFSGVEHMGEVPFYTVFIHGIVRDSQGRKMSKSLGNGIDPLEVIDRFGADALRFMLATGVSPGGDMRFIEERVTSCRNFANKLWNAVRFVLMNADEGVGYDSLPNELSAPDKWVLTKLMSVILEVTDNIDRFELGLAATKLYDFTWDIVCDWYIELCKARLTAGGEAKSDALKILIYVMDAALKLLHPFMPFITEELWQGMKAAGAGYKDCESIMISSYPVPVEELTFEDEAAEFEMIIEVIKAIRNRRAELNVPPSKQVSYYITTERPEVFAQAGAYIKRLAAGDITIGEKPDGECVTVVTANAMVYIPAEQMIDKEKERARLLKELEAAKKDYEIITGKLLNQKFMEKAPEQVVKQEHEKLARVNALIAKIESSLA